MSFSPEFFYGLGALLLLAALAYGVIRYRARDKSLDAVTEAATRAEYKAPEGRDEP